MLYGRRANARGGRRAGSTVSTSFRGVAKLIALGSLLSCEFARAALGDSQAVYESKYGSGKAFDADIAKTQGADSVVLYRSTKEKGMDVNFCNGVSVSESHRAGNLSFSDAEVQQVLDENKGDFAWSEPDVVTLRSGNDLIPRTTYYRSDGSMLVNVMALKGKVWAIDVEATAYPQFPLPAVESNIQQADSARVTPADLQALVAFVKLDHAIACSNPSRGDFFIGNGPDAGQPDYNILQNKKKMLMRDIPAWNIAVATATAWSKTPGLEVDKAAWLKDFIGLNGNTFPPNPVEFNKGAVKLKADLAAIQ